MKNLFAITIIAFIFWGCKEENPTEPVPQTEPTVKILTPQNNAVFYDSLFIEVEADDDKGVVQVEIYIDNITDSSRTFFIEPYAFFWKPPYEPDSSRHIIYAKAYDGDENVSSSKVITVIHSSFHPPTNLSVRSISLSSLELSWVDNSNKEKGFQIERKNKNGWFRKIGVTNKNVVSFIDSTVNLDSNYSYRVKAFNDTSMTAYTEVLEAGYSFSYERINTIFFMSGNTEEIPPLIYLPKSNAIISAFPERNSFYYRQLGSQSYQSLFIGNDGDFISDISNFDEQRLLFATTTGKVIALDLPGFNNEKVFSVDSQKISSVTFLENKSSFAAASVSGEVKIFDYDDGYIASYSNVLSEGNVLLAYDMFSDILISASASGYFSHWKVAEQKLRLTQYVENPIVFSLFDEITKTLYIGQDNGILKLWEPASNVLLDSLTTHEGAVTSCYIGNKGNALITTGNDSKFILWNINSFSQYFSQWDPGAMKGNNSVIISENLDYIAASSDNVLKIWKNVAGWTKYK